MKKLTALLLAAGLVLSLVGCGAKEENAPAAEEKATEAAAATEAAGPTEAAVIDESREIKDEIVFAQSSDLTTMNPNIGTQERAYSLTNHMYDTLLVYDSDMNMSLGVLEEYEWEDDLTLVMKLREDVYFHNGDQMTAQDVIFTFEQRSARGSAFNSYIDVPNIAARDEFTVVIPFTSPHQSFIYQLTDPAFGIMPKDYFESVGEEGFAKAPIGSGPYKLKEYVTGDYYKLERFDEYWGGPAKTQYLTMKIVPEAGQRTIMLETGEIDVAYEIPYIDASKIQENEDLQFLQTPSMKIVMYYINTVSETPINNNLVRQAIEYAIDKEAIVDAVCYGYGAAANAIVPDVAIEYRDVKEPHNYDLEKAKALMKEAGCEDGFKMEIWTSSVQTNTEICQVVQDMLKQINIDAEIVVQDANTTDERIDAGDDYGMSLHFYSCNSGHVEYTLSNILPTGTLRNDSRYSSAEYDATYNEWLITTDEAKREELLTKMYEIQNEDTPVVPLYNEVKVLGATKNLEGFKLSRIGAHEYQDAVVYKD